MKNIPDNLYYINNKTYVGHVSELETVVNDSYRNMSSKRKIVILQTATHYQFSEHIKEFLEKNNYSNLVEIKDFTSFQDIIENDKKIVYLFDLKEKLLELVGSFNYSLYKELSVNNNKKDFELFFKSIFARTLLFGDMISEKDIENTNIENIKISLKSKNIPFDILFYLLNKDKISDKAVNFFVEKITSIREKIIAEQSEDLSANDLMSLVLCGKELNMSEKEITIFKNMFKKNDFNQVVEIQNIFNKYNNNSNLKKLENYSPLLRVVFEEFKESYHIQMKLFNINAFELKHISSKERKKFLFNIYDNMAFFSRRSTRIAYLPYS